MDRSTEDDDDDEEAASEDDTSEDDDDDSSSSSSFSVERLLDLFSLLLRTAGEVDLDRLSLGLGER